MLHHRMADMADTVFGDRRDTVLGKLEGVEGCIGLKFIKIIRVEISGGLKLITHSQKTERMQKRLRLLMRKRNTKT